MIDPLVVFGCVIASFLSCWIIVRHAKRLGLIDDPKKHKLPKVVHTRPVPRGGGVAIFVSFLIGMALYGKFDLLIGGFLLAVFLLCVVGYLDDIKVEGISPLFRLIVNFVVSLIMVFVGINVPFITNPLGGVFHLGYIESILFVMIWVSALQNVVGWSSGVDGQLSGFVIVAAITMALLGMRFDYQGQENLFIIAACTIGAYLGFFYWNWWPQKMMPGYGAKSIAGFSLAIMSVMAGAKVGTLILVLGIPIIDGAFVITKRLLSGRNPFIGGDDHLHHSLLKSGWSKRSIAIGYLGMSIVLGVIAYFLRPSTKYFTMSAVLLLIFLLILWFHSLSIQLKQQGRGNG